MVEDLEGRGVSVPELIGADFFRQSDIAYLQGLGLDINPKRTVKIAKAVREKLPLSFKDSRDARYSLRARIKGLGITDRYSTLMLAFNRACDLKLIEPMYVSELREPLGGLEQKVLALSAVALTNYVIAEKLGVSGEEVDKCKESIAEKFGTETLFPVVAKVRRDMELQLQRAGNA